MKSFIHFLVVVTVVTVTFLFVNLMTPAQVSIIFGEQTMRTLPGWLFPGYALLVALGAGWFAWQQLRGVADGAVSFMFLGAVGVGGVSFFAGFLGPILLGGGNQGPLLGIFITGPIGFVLGGVGGLGYWGLRKRKQPAIEHGD